MFSFFFEKSGYRIEFQFKIMSKKQSKSKGWFSNLVDTLGIPNKVVDFALWGAKRVAGPVLARAGSEIENFVFGSKKQRQGDILPYKTPTTKHGMFSEVLPRIHIKCKPECGKTLKCVKCTANTPYPNKASRCNSCGVQFKPNVDDIYHCPKNDSHPDGYCLCVQCVISHSPDAFYGIYGLHSQKYTLAKYRYYFRQKRLVNIKNDTNKYFSNFKFVDKAQFLIFYGEPGTGKTEMAKRLANYFHIPLLIAEPAQYLAKDNDSSQTCKNLKILINDAIKYQSCVLLFDEIDYLIGNKSSEAVKSQFRQLIDDHKVKNYLEIAI